ncbi:hypothetical protein L6R50_16420 [Myxococcota bacterium]|nr:hypothetical protein [Myxococcota bacterium]
MSERVAGRFPGGIGGFPGLEIGPPRPPPHPGAVPLSTGRAALALVLDTVRPGGVLLPAYTCPVVLQPVERRGIPWRLYSLGPDLRPREPLALRPGEVLVAVNHFGVLDAVVDDLAGRFGERLVIDDSQALFHRPRPGSWAFHSARKQVGVPDGAWLYAPRPVTAPERRNEGVSAEHLLRRLAGETDSALEAFRAHEARLDDAVLGVSTLSERLLSAIDFDLVAARRRRNFARLHERLGARNRLPLDPGPGAVPLCYPFLPGRAVDRTELHRRGIFVPTYWPDLPAGADPGARDLAARLLPLPIDQRYGDAEMDAVAEEVEGLVG